MKNYNIINFKTICTSLLFVLIFSKTSLAQVEDISLTLSPKGEYVWWDDKAGIEDGLMYGGNLGFGFGEYLEIRALYMQSHDLKRDFSEFGLPTGYESVIDPESELDITRWGGELRANIGTGGLNPFITLGTGVQKIETDFDTETENIYASGGLGIKLKLADRISLTLEGKATALNSNSNALLSESEKNELGLTPEFFENERLYNFSALASLQFYLGGRVPGELTDLDRAYIDKFKGGLKGLKFVLEPASSYIEFDDDLAFRDSYFLGGYLGLDFNEYIGIHGFYFQGVENEEIFDDFDDIAMYGAEIRANLNSGNGVVPYLVLGGGYLNAYSNNYLGVDGQTVESTEFAKGGIGLKIPVSKYFSINASASSLLTSGSNFEDVTNTNSLQNSWNYSVGLNLHLSGKTEDPNKLYKSKVQSQVNQKENELTEAYQKQLEQQKLENQKRLNNLKKDYKQRLDSLNTELEVAKKNNDLEKAIKILEESKETQENLDKVEDVEKKNQTSSTNSSNNTSMNNNIAENNQAPKNADEQNKVDSTPEAQDNATEKKEGNKNLSPEQYEYMISLILKQMKDEESKKNLDSENIKVIIEKEDLGATNKTKVDEQFNEYDKALEVQKDKIAALEEELAKKNEQQSNEDSKKKSEEDEALKKQLEAENAKMKALEEEENPEDEYLDNNVDINKKYKRDLFNNYDYVEEEKPLSFSETIIYKGSSLFTGVNFGGQTTFNTGVKGHFGIASTKFEIMPEITTGIADPFSFGVAVNAVHPFKLYLPYNISPYAGLGGGYLFNDDESNFTGNVVLGFYADALGGRLYFDYTNRNIFDFNQFALGYRFNF